MIELLQRLESEDPDEVLDALMDAWRLTADPRLTKAIRPLLSHQDGEIRAWAMKVLGARWVQPGTEAIARKMMYDDACPLARAAALRAVSSFHRDTSNLALSQEFYAIAKDPDGAPECRASALWAVLSVMGVPLQHWPRPTGSLDITGDTDWDFFDSVVRGDREPT